MLSRRRFTQKLSLSLGSWPIWGFLGPQRNQDTYRERIRQAGNAESERERFQLLRQALKLPDLPSEARPILQQVLSVVEAWASGRERLEKGTQNTPRASRYLHNFFNWSIDLETWVMPQVSESDPLYPLIAWYRGRMLLQMVIQHGHLQKNPELREAYFGEARALIDVAHEAFPQNRVIAMYLGKSIPWKPEFEPDPLAPAWANSQRETLEKLTHIIHWWIDQRQLPDGQFGGGWGDDVEMWRLWIPVLVGFADPKTMEGQQLLSEGLWSQDYMKAGYTDRMTDVEHTAEDSSDTCTAMMHIRPDDPIWKQRARKLVELMRELWTGTNDRGFLQFKSTYFTANEVDTDPRKACDTVYHPRAIQPALLYWQRTGDEEIGKGILEWMKVWVDATAREEGGKAAGIIPSAIHWPEGRVGGLTEDWWRPGNHTDDPLYVWPSAMRIMVNTLLLCYHQSQDRLYLEPLFSMAQIYREFLRKEDPNGDFPTGSKAWCAAQMGDFLPDVLGKYRKLSGDVQFDDLLQKQANGYVHMLLSQKRDLLHQAIETNADSLRLNYSAFTEEVRWTDRVFRFHPSYLNHFLESPIPSFDPHFLFSTLTGNVGNALYFPINAVRWHTEPKEIAILVTKANSSEFQVEFFHFGASERYVEAEFFLLEVGAYQIRLRDQVTQALIHSELVTIYQERKIEVRLPSRRLCVWEILSN